jgi:hypothetical protein
MRTATITLRGADFAQKMSEMRTWLDQQLFEPIRFIYKQDREIIVISVDFPEGHQAEAFQSRFAGRQHEMASSLRSVQKLPNRAAGDGSGRPETLATVGRAETRATFGGVEARGTMAQACWWRLVAEEIRAEADNFGSEAAKETMELAAKAWEQLAEELEHRLARNGDQQQGLFLR